MGSTDIYINDTIHIYVLNCITKRRVKTVLTKGYNNISTQNN